MLQLNILILAESMKLSLFFYFLIKLYYFHFIFSKIVLYSLNREIKLFVFHKAFKKTLGRRELICINNEIYINFYFPINNLYI